MDAGQEDPPAAGVRSLIGLTIDGRYRIVSKIGAGGMGQVFCARQLNVDREVAIKVIDAQHVDDPQAVARFENEARIVSMLRHAHTIRLFDFGRLDDGRPYIVSERLLGAPLSRVLAGGALSERRTLSFLRQICDALSEAHGLGIIHRDLKPQNVFIEIVAGEEAVKVLDFGIAKIAGQSPSTTVGTLVGTPAFMSPERARGREVDARCDLYSLGILAYQCISGRLPFSASDPVATLLLQVSEPPPPLDPAAVSPELNALILRLLAKDPERRPRSAADVKRSILEIEQRSGSGLVLGQESALSRDTESVKIAATPSLEAERRPRRVRFGVAIAIALLSLLGGAALLALRSPVGKPVDPLVDDGLRYRVPVGPSPVRGAKDALVTIVEFGDFQCPYSKYIEPALRELLAEYPNELRLVWKDMPLGVHPRAEAAATFARRVARDKGGDAFWTAHDRLFDLQPGLEDEAITQLARELQLSEANLYRATDVEAVNKDIDLGVRILVSGIPHFFVNGRRVIGADRDHLARVITEELERARENAVASGTSLALYYDTVIKDGRSEVPRRRVAPLPVGPLNPARGSGPVLIQEVFDPSDPFCNWLQPSLLRVVERFADRVRLVLFLTTPAEQATGRGAAEAAIAAFELDPAAFWRMHQAMVESQIVPNFGDPPPDSLSARALRDYAQQAGLELSAFDRRLESGEPKAELDRQAQAVASAHLNRCTVLIDGEVHSGAEPAHGLESVIRRRLDDRGAD
jgi:protein-disulfide isomerase/tRNA A-37 threonylcarbamoyl transferase component Bud32